MISISCLESKLLNNNNWYGRFQLAPFQKGEGLTVANALRRTLLAEKSNFFITWVDFYNAEIPYSVLTGMRESIFDILLNLKQVIFTSDKIIPNRNHFFKSPSRNNFKPQKVKFLSKKRFKAESEINLLNSNSNSPSTPDLLRSKRHKICEEMRWNTKQQNLNIGPNHINNQSIRINPNFKNQKTGFKNVFCKNQILGKMINSNHEASSLVRLGIFNKINSVEDQSENKSGLDSFLVRNKEVRKYVNSKKIGNSTYIGYICAKGPTIIYAKDIKLPKGLKCVDPDKYIVTLADDGLFYLRFALTTEIKTLPLINASNLSISINKGIKFNNVTLKTFPKTLFNKEIQSCSSFRIISSMANQEKKLKKSNQQYLNRLSQIKLYNSKIDSVNYTKNLIKSQRLLLTNDSIKQFNFQNTSIIANIQKTCLLNIQVKHYYYKSGRFDRFLFDLIKPFKPTLKSTYYNEFSLKENLFYQSSSLKVLTTSVPFSIEWKGSQSLPNFYKIFSHQKSSSQLSINYKPGNPNKGETSLWMKGYPCLGFVPSFRFPLYDNQSRVFVDSINKDGYLYFEKNKNGLKFLKHKQLKREKIAVLENIIKKKHVIDKLLNNFTSRPLPLKNNINGFFHALPLESHNFISSPAKSESYSLKNKYLLRWQKTFKSIKTSSIYDYFNKLSTSQAALTCLLSTKPRIETKISLLSKKLISISRHKNVLNTSAFIFSSLHQNMEQFFSFVGLRSRILKLHKPYIEKFLTLCLSFQYSQNQILWFLKFYILQHNNSLNFLNKNPVRIKNLVPFPKQELTHILFLEKQNQAKTLDRFGRPDIGPSPATRMVTTNAAPTPLPLETKEWDKTQLLKLLSWMNENQRPQHDYHLREFYYSGSYCSSTSNLFYSKRDKRVLSPPTVANQKEAYVQLSMVKGMCQAIGWNSKKHSIIKNTYKPTNGNEQTCREPVFDFFSTANNLRVLNNVTSISGYMLCYSLFSKKANLMNQPWIYLNRYKSFNSVQLPTTLRTRPSSSIRQVSYKPMWTLTCHFEQNPNLERSWLDHLNSSSFVYDAQTMKNQFLNASYLAKKRHGFPYKCKFHVGRPGSIKKTFNSIPTNSVILKPIYLNVEQIIYILKQTTKFRKNQRINPRFFNSFRKLNNPKVSPADYYLRFYKISNFLYDSLWKFSDPKSVKVKPTIGLSFPEFGGLKDLHTKLSTCRPEATKNIEESKTQRLGSDSFFTRSERMGKYPKRNYTHRPTLSHVWVFGSNFVFKSNWLDTSFKSQSNPLYGSRLFYMTLKIVSFFLKPFKYYQHALNQIIPFSLKTFSYFPKITVTNSLKINDLYNEPYNINIYNSKISFNLRYTYPFKYTIFETRLPFQSITSESTETKMAQRFISNQPKHEYERFQTSKKYKEEMELLNSTIVSYRHFDSIHYNESFKIYTTLAYTCLKTYEPHLSKYHNFNKPNQKKLQDNNFKITGFQQWLGQLKLTQPFGVSSLNMSQAPTPLPFQISFVPKETKWVSLVGSDSGDTSKSAKRWDESVLEKFGEVSIFDGEFVKKNKPLLKYFGKNKYLLDKISKISYFKPIQVPKFKSFSIKQIIIYKMISKIFSIYRNNSFGLNNYSLPSIFDNTSKWRIINNANFNDAFITIPCTWSLNFQSNGLSLDMSPNITNWFYSFVSPIQNPFFMDYASQKDRQWPIRQWPISQWPIRQWPIRHGNPYLCSLIKITFPVGRPIRHEFPSVGWPESKTMFLNFFGKSKEIIKNKLYWSRNLINTDTNTAFSRSQPYEKKKNINTDAALVDNRQPKVLKRSLKKLAINFEAIYYKNFLWNSRKITLRILNNAVLPLVANRKYNISHFVPKKNYRVAAFIHKTVPITVPFNFLAPFVDNGQLKPRFYLNKDGWSHKNFNNLVLRYLPTPSRQVEKQWNPEIDNYQTPRFYSIRHKTLETTNFMCEKTYPTFINQNETERTLKPNSLTSQEKKPLSNSLPSFSCLGYKRRPFFYGSLRHFQERDESYKSPFVNFLTKRKQQSENNEKYFLSYNQITPEKLASFRRRQWNKKLTQASKLSNESNISSVTNLKAKSPLSNNLWRSSFFGRYSLYAISTKSDLFLQNLISSSGLKNQTKDASGFFQPENTSTYDSWTPSSNEIKKNLDEPVFFKEMQSQYKQNDTHQFLNIKPSIKLYEKTIQKILKSQDYLVINDFVPGYYYKWQKAIRIAILNRLKRAEFNEKKNIDSAIQSAPRLVKNKYYVQAQTTGQPNGSTIDPSSASIIEAKSEAPSRFPIQVSLVGSRGGETPKYAKPLSETETLKNYEHDFGNPLRRGMSKESLSIYNIKSSIKLDQKAVACKFTTPKSLFRADNQYVIKSWKSFIYTAEANIYFCFYYPLFIQNCNLPWQKSKSIFYVPKHCFHKRTIDLKLSSKSISTDLFKTININKEINTNLFMFYTQLASSENNTHKSLLHNETNPIDSFQVSFGTKEFVPKETDFVKGCSQQWSEIQRFKNLTSSVHIHIQNQGSYGTVSYFTIKEGLNSIYKVNYIVESHVSPSKPMSELEFHSNQKNGVIDFGDNLERSHRIKKFENIQRDSAITDSLTVSNFLSDTYSFTPSKTIILSSFNELINSSVNRSQIQNENEYIQIDIWTNGELSPRQALLNAFKKLFELFYNLSKYNCLKPIEI